MRFAIWTAVLAACSAGSASTALDAEPPARSTDGPVVLELFTSQGCSSCPPADRYLASLRPGSLVAGRPVIPLAFHVDYWNYLGWADPFSSEQWSERQGEYADRLGAGRVYTPALVVAGRADTVGAKRAAIERLVAAAPPTALLDATLRRDDGELRVTATPPAGATAWAAVVEDGLLTEPDAGENSGAALRNDHIVRALVRVDGEARIPLAPAWGAVRVVAFAQEPDGAIVAARALD